ncbi:MAG: zinc ribbon domain-containing protein [Chloroflexi bacterium]|nr:zinc ribbon domain-containing protein [Chloroflexota bacterium]
MPIYEYTCDTCFDEFEMRRSFSEEGIPPCPTCNGTGQVRRRFSTPAIVFKGSGFYVTDSRSKNSTGKPANRSSDSSGSSESSGKEDTKSVKQEQKAKPTKKETKNTD